jgi:hypothetical protein
MKHAQLEEIIACLPRGRTKFYYFKDRYALMLLSMLTRKETSIQSLQNSPYRRLLDKPVVREILGKNGNPRLAASQFDAFWPEKCHCYLLTLGKWDGSRKWRQTSRRGWNLVLQLNFSSRHNRAYKAQLTPDDNAPFQYYGHPVAGKGYNTLAWARLDIDMNRDEALIEEIQTDWLRLARQSEKDFCQYTGEDKKLYIPWYVRGLNCDLQQLQNYMEKTLRPHMKIWQEAMLAAAIWFLQEEIGISTIYYHTFDYGCQLKNISGVKPPRSLYTRLPTQFCFTKTGQAPQFLQKKKRKSKKQTTVVTEQQFYSLALK